MKKIFLASTIIALAAFANTSQAALIDNFSATQAAAVDNVTGGAVTTTNSALTGSDFSSRVYSADRTVGAGEFKVENFPALFSISTGPQVKGHGIVTWASAADINLVDLAGGLQADRFRLGNFFADSAFNLTLTVTDASSNTSTLSSVIAADFSGTGVNDLFFSGLVGTADLHAVRNLSLDFFVNINQSTDINFAFIETTVVPEPSAISLMGLVLAGFAVSRRKKA